MRGIKFRVWCKDFNEWEKDSIFLNKFGDALHFNAKRGNPVNMRPDSHVIQHSTGVKDKTGTEIFEGDICEYKLVVDGKVEDEFKGEVIFRKCSFQLDGSKYNESIVYFEDFMISEFESDLTVVSHVYENLEK